MGSVDWIITGVVALITALIGLWIGIWGHRRLGRARLTDAESRAAKIVAEADKEAQLHRKTAAIEAREEWIRAKAKFDEEMRVARQELDRREQSLGEKESHLARRGDQLEGREAELRKLQEAARHEQEELARQRSEAERLVGEENRRLEQISGLTAEAARERLLKNMEDAARADGALRARRIREEAERNAEREARRVITMAIQRLAAEQSVESTVTVVSLPNEEMKGRIIGREGRNIRAFETATGVDVIIDDTPEAVLLSGYDPVRREVARLALETLVRDGRIHPGRIEEVVEKAAQAVERELRETGEGVTLDLGVHGVHPDLIRHLGALRHRTSFGQNVLKHSVEVGLLAGMMAAELGLDEALARRCGLLHDIGKAVDHNVEGPHAIIGMDLVRRCNESEEVAKAVGAHHGEIEAESVYAFLVQAGDGISGARPGARRETLEAYVKRLERLEGLAESFAGVEKCYAIQAGREIRIMVQHKEVDDNRAATLASDVAQRIEKELQYPGQIKVVVIRETRAIEYAR
ncbi:MAG: ribonuclease Y [Candidatus Eisenbacteria sp.]|nr:ribonuclease Y [Candidatus Eisenbacteria bacterium]